MIEPKTCELKGLADAFSDDWLAEWLEHCRREWEKLQVARNLSEHFCVSCGCELEIVGEELHCKKICASCGAKRDCSDP